MQSSTYALACMFASAVILARAVRLGRASSGATLGVPSETNNPMLHEDARLRPHEAGAETLTGIWILGLVAMELVALVLYRSKGWLVLVRIQLYLLALSTVTISVKNVYIHHDFAYAKALSAIHMICCFLFTWAALVMRRLVYGDSLLIPSRHQLSRLILPVSFLVSSSLVFNNMALAYSNVSMVEAIGATTPVYGAVLSLTVGRNLDKGLLLPLGLICGGVMLGVSSDLTFSLSGVALAILAAFVRACKSVMQFELMAPKEDLEEPVLDPMSVLAWMSLPSGILLLAWSGCSEGDEPFKSLISNINGPLVIAVGTSCVNACVLNLTALFVVKDLGVVASQVVGQLKTILVVLGSVALLGDQLRLLQVFGLSIAFLGISWYNARERALKDPLRTLATTTYYEGK
mmetsp:Transcript_69285/g.122780  ORF Transcript_69285/g.122780 Transcript_69285/m.122780 type:complete len:404 (+) Transcript_69285:30-1241(+)